VSRPSHRMRWNLGFCDNSMVGLLEKWLFNAWREIGSLLVLNPDFFFDQLTFSEFLLVRFLFSACGIFWLINNQNQRKNSAINLWTSTTTKISKLGSKLGSGGDRAHIAGIFLEKKTHIPAFTRVCWSLV
jgi:hypothetical protein